MSRRYGDRIEGVRSFFSRPSAWVTLLLLAGISALVVMITVTTSDYSASLNAKSEQVDQLEGDIVSLRGTKTLTVAEGQQVISSAKEAGEAVATAQNGFAATDDAHAQTDEMGSYFTEDDHGAKSRWYDVGSVEGAKWEFCTPYSFSSTYVNVVWQCKKGDELLMYVTAQYNSSSNKFTSVEMHTTEAGNEAYLASIDEATRSQYAVDADDSDGGDE